MARVGEVDKEAIGNGEFIAHAREDIPYLRAQLKEAREKLEAVEEMRTGWELGRPSKDDEWWIRELDRILHPKEG